MGVLVSYISSSRAPQVREARAVRHGDSRVQRSRRTSQLRDRPPGRYHQDGGQDQEGGDVSGPKEF